MQLTNLIQMNSITKSNRFNAFILKQKVIIPILLLGGMLFAQSVFSQNMGNIGYRDPGGKGGGKGKGKVNYGTNNSKVILPANNINISVGSSKEFVLSVKGMSNIKADAYVAVFSVSQVGKDVDEVNHLLDARIDRVKLKVDSLLNTSVLVDMISFVPVYTYEREKKIFSKDTYNEIPEGFELKKNLHIKFKSPEIMDELIRICAESEIYELVRVDYFSKQLEQTKLDMAKKARAMIQSKLKDRQILVGFDIEKIERTVNEGYIVNYPLERYNSYTAYKSTSLKLKRNPTVNKAEVAVTQFYQPVFDKEFDFVVNPVVVEPVIQIMYELKMHVRILPAKKPVEIKKEVVKQYYFVTPDGQLRKLEGI